MTKTSLASRKMREWKSGLRGPYVKVRASYFYYGPNNPVSKSFITWHHHFSNNNDFLVRPTHCMVSGSNVYESFVRY